MRFFYERLCLSAKENSLIRPCEKKMEARQTIVGASLAGALFLAEPLGKRASPDELGQATRGGRPTGRPYKSAACLS